jgi:cyclopropane fatty-acyl-phospholipid synthase-like methyltransferase
MRLFYPATERNRGPILEVLKSALPKTGSFLEIASGSGEHVIHFAKDFPDVTWQPSDLEDDCLNSIQAWIEHEGMVNIQSPIRLDTTADDWPDFSLNALLCINMVHISPWEATIGLMKKAGTHLNEEGVLYLYGPYRRNGRHTAPSNESFEGWLKGQDPRFGVRHMEEVEAEAAKNGLKLTQIIDMPANNFSLVFVKE